MKGYIWPKAKLNSDSRIIIFDFFSNKRLEISKKYEKSSERGETLLMGS